MKPIFQIIVTVAFLVQALAAASTEWLDADQKPVSFASDEEIIEFLETAKVVSQKKVNVGINGINKVLLEKDGIRMHGAFRDIRVNKRNFQMPNGVVRASFRDDCRFEIAAYQLSKLLGLDNVPPVVKRKINGKKGTLQLWIEKAMTENKRRKGKIRPPRPMRRWVNQTQVMHVFDNLIYNEDRNLGNILIDSNWKLWMIDHTRAFRRFKQLRQPAQIRYCQRTLWERLQKLDKEMLEKELQGTLGTYEISTLLVRRDVLLHHIQGLIDQKGEAVVLFEGF